MKDEQITVPRLMIDDSMFVPTPTLLSDVLCFNFLVIFASVDCLTCIGVYSMCRHKQPSENSSAQASVDELKYLCAQSNDLTDVNCHKVILWYIFQQIMRLSKYILGIQGLWVPGEVWMQIWGPFCRALNQELEGQWFEPHWWTKNLEKELVAVGTFPQHCQGNFEQSTDAKNICGGQLSHSDTSSPMIAVVLWMFMYNNVYHFFSLGLKKDSSSSSFTSGSLVLEDRGCRCMCPKKKTSAWLRKGKVANYCSDRGDRLWKKLIV